MYYLVIALANQQYIRRGNKNFLAEGMMSVMEDRQRTQNPDMFIETSVMLQDVL